MKVFFDTSAFAKLFIREAGTQHTYRLYAKASSMAVCGLGWLEARSAIVRRERMGDISPADGVRAKVLLKAEATLGRVETVDLPASLLLIAEALLVRRELRSLDAVQLASCLEWIGRERQSIFVCADRRLAEAGIAEGLSVVVPIGP